MAAEFFGNCQICDREHKSSSSAIAKHGYTIRSGWQEGACFGSGGKPVQVSCDLIEGALEAAREYVERTEVEIKRLAENPLYDRGTVSMVIRTATRTGDVYRVERVTLEIGEKGLPVAKDSSRKTIKTWPTYSGIKTVEAAAKQLADLRISFLKKTIDDAKSHIVYLVDRLACWKPCTLRPVSAAEKEANSPKLHFAAMKFGRETGLCAMSARSSQTWRQTTSDRTRVTCLACLKQLTLLDDLPEKIAADKARDHARKVAAFQAEIRNYQKWIGLPKADAEAVARWTESLARAKVELERLKADAPGECSKIDSIKTKN